MASEHACEINDEDARQKRPCRKETTRWLDDLAQVSPGCDPRFDADFHEIGGQLTSDIRLASSYHVWDGEFLAERSSIRFFFAANGRFRERTGNLDNEARLRDRVEPTAKDERDPHEFP